MYKRKVWVPFFLGILIGCSVLTFIFFVFLKGNINKSKVVVNDKTVIEKKKEQVVVAINEISKGAVIEKANLAIKERASDDLPKNYVSKIENVLGKRASDKIESNTMFSSSMAIDVNDLYNSDERIKDYELPGGLVGGTVKDGDLIDIEILKKDGSTYVIASKKKVEKKIEDRIIIKTTWEERKMLNYAITEVAVKGGKITAVLYIDSNQQQSKVTYTIPENMSMPNDVNENQTKQDIPAKRAN